ncbi:hypothetical protein ABNK63_11620 [Rhodanobacter sp. IGA1.0]|uniref:GlsB/YeaQ/YmgE family stress response membrane protein n=1 Tax=Rhodanobacter sp. IGA1.0 TaxID=3158582 RepID=A0AAU7QI22_9GAMM
MKTATAIFAAIAGASAGFIAGVFAAFLGGVHEKPAFFAISLSSSIALALASLAGASRLHVAFPRAHYAILAASMAGAGVGVWSVLRMIKVI